MGRYENMLSYLPEFLRDFEELKKIIAAEAPEFDMLIGWGEDAAAESYIETASEWGISRLEQIAGILPDEGSTLEERRRTLMVRWFDPAPYTVKTLRDRLAALQGDDDVSVNVTPSAFLVEIETAMGDPALIEEAAGILRVVLPANMVARLYNRWREDYQAHMYCGVVELRAEISQVPVPGYDMADDYLVDEAEIMLVDECSVLLFD